MPNRAERRRQEKEKPVAVKYSEEKKELENAEKELIADLDEDKSAPLDIFISQLFIWQQADTQRNLAKESFQLAYQINSKQDKDVWLKQFAEAKKKLEIMEPKLINTLKQMEKEETETALTQRFIMPGVGFISCSKILAEKLRLSLNGTKNEYKENESNTEV